MLKDASPLSSLEPSQTTLPSLSVRAIYADKTGVGDYIVEDMERSGMTYVTGVNFTDTIKEAMAMCLREKIRTADYPVCGWRGHVEDLDGSWRVTCPKGCSHEDGRPVGLRPLLHVPYDPDLYAELNVERFELGETGKLLFSHPEGTHDDRFWAVALPVYAAEQIKSISATFILSSLQVSSIPFLAILI